MSQFLLSGDNVSNFLLLVRMFVAVVIIDGITKTVIVRLKNVFRF